MPKMPKESKKRVPNTAKTSDGTNTRRRKSKGQNEKSTETSECILRQREPEIQILNKPKQLVTIKELAKLPTGTKFTFTSPGAGSKQYICTIQGHEIICQRTDDNYSFARLKKDLLFYLNGTKIVCTLI